MEASVVAFLILIGALFARDYSPSKAIEPAILLLLLISFWLSMQNIIVSDDALILSRRFGLFKRIIPLHMITNIDAKLIPVSRGALPLLHIYTTDKHIYKIGLCSHERHIQVVIAIRSRINAINNTQQSVAGFPSQRIGSPGP